MIDKVGLLQVVMENYLEDFPDTKLTVSLMLKFIKEVNERPFEVDYRNRDEYESD